MKSRLYFFFSVLLLVYGNLSAQTDTLRKESFGLFIDEEPLEITLRFDITTYLRKKPIDDFLKAEIVIHPGRPDSIVEDIRLKTRGEFRRRECQMAPIELNFKKTKFGYSDLDSIDKLKVVTQCSFGVNDENYLLREYLVYKFFNEVTDTSFKVRLVRINFEDTEKGRKPMRQWGILIEPVEVLAKRTNTIQIKSENLTQKHIFPFVMDRMAVFNYMVGNYDWSIPGQHNVKVFKPADLPMNQYAIAIPYDFDWTGVVNPPYAIPVETVGIQTVRERIYLGICRSPEKFNRQLIMLESKKETFYRIVNEFPYLKEREKNDIIAYLETFFDKLTGNHNYMLTTLRNSCKNF